MNIKENISATLVNMVSHYNHKKFWKMRMAISNPDAKISLLTRFYYLYRIKKTEAFHNAYLGTSFNTPPATFATPPILPHYLNGIIISHYAKIGANCTIYQQVTIAQAPGKTSATIGDNCIIGAGAKILGNIKIGDNVKIGANAVVLHDLPSNCTAVGVPAKIVKIDGKKVCDD